MAIKIGLYTKEIAATVVTGLNAAMTAMQDGTITSTEWITIASVTLGALAAVWAVPNTPLKVRKYGKAITSGLVSGLGALLTVLLAGHNIDSTAIINIAIALVTGLGLVHIAPNAESSDEVVTPTSTSTGTLEDSDDDFDDEVAEDVPEDAFAGEGGMPSNEEDVPA